MRLFTVSVTRNTPKRSSSAQRMNKYGALDLQVVITLIHYIKRHFLEYLGVKKWSDVSLRAMAGLWDAVRLHKALLEYKQ